MGSKIFLVFGLVMAIALLSSSGVAARNLLAETSANMRKAEANAVGCPYHRLRPQGAIIGCPPA
ncbi:hypothetical protein CUMW_158070 [Citrus unshiu]|uniref:Uncharacterized protein n=1 Tax=Citrus unshiu TaxID=55188 RepID=A0A2H5PQH8_CITUN|nr:hypothetical protein CUMW_158070 [Citrus unshiu]